MKVKEEKYLVSKLVQALESGQLLRNPEYQRGEAWSGLQKAAFVDSIFRGYPVPALFLHATESPGLDDVPSVKYEIVDGQQRLTSLRDYKHAKFPTFEVTEKSRLRLPKSVRDMAAPWAGKFYEGLSDELRAAFDSTEITVFVIGPNAHPDEVRDLFIRLQSGTALTRQQIRDAWPGNLGPFIERLAGKLDKHPSHRLFALVDKRGQRSEDEEQRDLHVTDRQTCAQLLRIFLARERDPNVYPSVSANELDAMYHEYTDFDPQGPVAERFKTVLNWAANVFSRVKERVSAKTKFRRMDVTAVMMYLQDVSKNDLFKLDNKSADELAGRIAAAERTERPVGKSTAGRTLETYYQWWRDNVGRDAGIRLDSRRTFDEQQRDEIRRLANGRCAVCAEEVGDSDAEFDHYPVAYRDGGPTEVPNGRLVHARCHPRGRPSADA